MLSGVEHDAASRGGWARATCAAGAKACKTTTMVTQILGVCPWAQGAGAVVADPADLLVLTFDPAALRCVPDWMRQHCGATDKTLTYRVLPLEETVMRVAKVAAPGHDTFFGACRQAAEAAVRGVRGEVPVIMVSSVTVMAEAMLREIMGQPGNASAPDPREWGPELAVRIAEVRDILHSAEAHVLWEAHVDRREPMFEAKGAQTEESLQIAGQAGRKWCNRQDTLLRLARGLPIADGVYRQEWDTRTFLEGKHPVGGGRGDGKCAPREPDLTTIFRKRGLAVASAAPLEPLAGPFSTQPRHAQDPITHGG